MPLKPYAFNKKNGTHSWQHWREKERCRLPDKGKEKSNYKADPEVVTWMTPQIIPDAEGLLLGNLRMGVGILTGVGRLTHQSMFAIDETDRPQRIFPTQ